MPQGSQVLNFRFRCCQTAGKTLRVQSKQHNNPRGPVSRAPSPLLVEEFSRPPVFSPEPQRQLVAVLPNAGIHPRFGASVQGPHS